MHINNLPFPEEVFAEPGLPAFGAPGTASAHWDQPPHRAETVPGAPLLPGFPKTLAPGLFLAIVIYCAQPLIAAPDQGDHWVGTWGASPQLTEPRNLPPPPGLTSNTLRQVVQVSIGGKQLRVRFSNAFGTNPVTMSSVHLALSAGRSGIQTNSDQALIFQGKPLRNDSGR